MFTGIIEAVGTIREIVRKDFDRTFIIDTGRLDISDVSAGDSICVNGVCLTVIELKESGFATDVSNETLSCTTFGKLEPGNRVNLEKSLRLSDRLGGHLVSGHVDCVGTVADIRKDDRSVRYEISVPDSISRYICKKGSACIDGVSLTVNEFHNNVLCVNIIPHTFNETIFSVYEKGTGVNIETDLIARYLEKLVNTPH